MEGIFLERNVILLISVLLLLIFLIISIFMKKNKVLYIFIILSIITCFIMCYFLYKNYVNILIKEGVINSDVYIYDIELINYNLNLYNITVDDLYDDNDNKIRLSIFIEDEIFLKENNKYNIEYNKYTKKLLNYTY